MRSIRPVAVIAAVVLVVDCGGNAYDLVKRFTPADADARSRATLLQLTAHHVDSVEARLAPSIDRKYGHIGLEQIDSLIGGQRFDTTRVIGARTNTVDGIRHVNLTYELHSQMGWTLANVATLDTAGGWLIEGISARPME